MNDRIALQGIQVFGYHGVHSAEKQLGQRFVVDVWLGGDFSLPGTSDQLKDAVDYTRVHSLVVETLRGESFNLLERAASRLCEVLLGQLMVDNVEVTVKKTHPPIPDFFGQAAVTMQRDRRWFEG